MEEWKEYKLGDLYAVHNGLSKGGKFFGSGYPFLSFKTVFNNYFLPPILPDLVQSNEKEQNGYSIKRGDVFVTRTSETPEELGMSSVALKDYPFATYNGFTKRLRPKNPSLVFPEFIGYYLRSTKFRNFFYGLASSMSTRASLANGDLLGIRIFLPSYETQERIAWILKSLDDKIELNRRINKNLEQQAQALFKSWFVDGTNIELNYHELGNITSITAGGDKPSIYSKELTEKYYTPIYSNGIENEGLYGYTDFAKINSSSITISARGTIGYICLRTKPYVPIVRLISVIPKKEELSAEYLYLWALRQNFSATGTTQQQLTVPNLKKISIGIPAKEILKKFNNIVIPIFQSIEKNKDENKNLAQLRDTLLPKLMSGELKLSEIKTKLYE